MGTPACGSQPGCCARGGGTITIRRYRERDAEAVGQLIADTYSAYNLAFLPVEERGPFLGPFRHAGSCEEAHRAAIAEAIRASMVFVAEDVGEIVGVLRGRRDKLQSLFVRDDYQRRGVGRRLVESFERECVRLGSTQGKVQSTLFAVPFYAAMGYKRTTGVRSMRSFEGTGLM